MTDHTALIRLERSIKLYELILTWCDGRHCHARMLRFWADPCDYREEALRQFLDAFKPNLVDTESAKQQWSNGNGQIILGPRLYEIEYLDEVAPVVVCMDGSTIVAVTQHGQDIPYDIEQIR
jgi:hypothetical protein